MSPSEITAQIVDAARRMHTQAGPGRNEKNMRAEAQRTQRGEPQPKKDMLKELNRGIPRAEYSEGKNLNR